MKDIDDNNEENGELEATIQSMSQHQCHPEADGYIRETTDEHGTYCIYVCGECGQETPIDR
jgi:hypothetical protein